MNMIDFIYDNKRLSEFGLMLVDFSTENEKINVANELNGNNVRAVDADHWWRIAPQYQDVFEYTFSVGRDPCGPMGEEEISDIEIRKVMQWLNRRGFHEFIPVYADKEFSRCFFMATFNCQVVRWGQTVVGFILQMTTNAPWAYGDRETFEGTMGPDTPFEIKSTSDDYGYIYADCEIEPLSGGEVIISNELEPEYLIAINNTSAGNIYKMHEHTKQLEVIQGSHYKLPNDFNYNFLRICNYPDSRTNVFTSTVPVKIKISYLPIRKVGMVG